MGDNMRRIFAISAFLLVCGAAVADVGAFDMARWDSVIADVRARATAKNISTDTINATLRNPAFIPSIVKNFE